MNSIEKLKALLEFLGPELVKEYTGLIHDLREQKKREEMINRETLDYSRKTKDGLKDVL